MSDGCSDSDDEDLAFSNLDMTEVDFDNSDDHNEEHAIDEQDEKLILFEKEVLFDTAHQISASKAPSFVLSKCDSNESETSELMKMSRDFNAGKYVNVLRSKTAFHVFAGTELSTQQESLESEIDLLALLASNARQRIISYCSSLERCIEVEIIAVSALSLFLQLNYTGPSLENNLDSTAEIVTKESILEGIHPHPLFKTCLHYSEPSDNSYEEPSSNDFDQKTKKSWNIYHNRILSYLSVDGEWPCQVCENPYFLFISRIILNTLANPNRKDWTHSVDFSDVKSSPIPNENKQKQSDDILNKNDSLYKKKQDLSSQTSYETTPTEIFLEKIAKLRLVHLWNSRAIVAHQRLLQCDEPSLTLWMECKDSFERCKQLFCYDVNEENRTNAVTLSTEKSNITEDENEVDNYHNHQGVAARVMLEWGLAEHHFDRDGKGKLSFQSACEYSGVQVNVMGAYGKRTKFQIDAKAQMLVQAFSTAPILKEDKISQNDESKNFDETGSKKIKIKEKEVQHDGEEILLDRVKFENEEFNVSEGNLNVLDQAILLALCLDVKNDNPMDGLTGEQMGGYLERVLIEHDDWMVYSTGLLERAWLECERVHSRERAILQIQALVDQHTNRLTITQSTFKSVEDSAPVQDRLRNVHFLVYPPRWEVMRDLAERYAKLGIVTTAAEIFEEIELWDEVVECYTHAGKASKAEEVVRRRLQIAETPRMWVALGGLTNDPQYYEKAIEISKGKFAVAYIELGQYYLKQGDVHKASDLFKKGLDVKPLTPHVWFLLGTVCMQISDWEVALQAFSEVVQQEPEEGDAWANIAAIHMHNKDPTKAYPAIIEVKSMTFLRIEYNNPIFF